MIPALVKGAVNGARSLFGSVARATTGEVVAISALAAGAGMGGGYMINRYNRGDRNNRLSITTTHDNNRRRGNIIDTNVDLNRYVANQMLEVVLFAAEDMRDDATRVFMDIALTKIQRDHGTGVLNLVLAFLVSDLPKYMEKLPYTVCVRDLLTMCRSVLDDVRPFPTKSDLQSKLGTSDHPVWREFYSRMSDLNSDNIEVRNVRRSNWDRRDDRNDRGRNGYDDDRNGNRSVFDQARTGLARMVSPDGGASLSTTSASPAGGTEADWMNPILKEMRDALDVITEPFKAEQARNKVLEENRVKHEARQAELREAVQFRLDADAMYEAEKANRAGKPIDPNDLAAAVRQAQANGHKPKP